MLDEREYRLTLEQMRANRSRSEVLFKKFTEAKDFLIRMLSAFLKVKMESIIIPEFKNTGKTTLFH